MAKLKVDLHEIFNHNKSLDNALYGAIEKAIEEKIPIIEIIPGKGSGQLKKRVLKFLEQPEIKKQYHRVDKDSKNHGRLFVRFQHKKG